MTSRPASICFMMMCGVMDGWQSSKEVCGRIRTLGKFPRHVEGVVVFRRERRNVGGDKMLVIDPRVRFAQVWCGLQGW